ncbi:MAG: hypothetical protein LUG95_08055 [Clostridiales bacterium]|nr:hypothetical protein [Clostridiales bacterium]
MKIPPVNKENFEQFIEQGKQIKEIKNSVNKIVPVISPTAKLIDIPTNDLMKYQQGVFLLLNKFSIIDSNYLTKAV